MRQEQRGAVWSEERLDCLGYHSIWLAKTPLVLINVYAKDIDLD